MSERYLKQRDVFLILLKFQDISQAYPGYFNLYLFRKKDRDRCLSLLKPK